MASAAFPFHNWSSGATSSGATSLELPLRHRVLEEILV
jgi:hypothetical protein